MGIVLGSEENTEVILHIQWTIGERATVYLTIVVDLGNFLCISMPDKILRFESISGAMQFPRLSLLYYFHCAMGSKQRSGVSLVHCEDCNNQDVQMPFTVQVLTRQ